MAERINPQREFDTAGRLVSKVCMKCGQRKAADEYWKNSSVKDGRWSYCMPCDARRRRARDPTQWSCLHHVWPITNHDAPGALLQQGGNP
ncbi:hypothetical protein [Methylogaea oryzae]|uniref:Uncharacterized protein n=1 Tax=Methylogaea oryzae TaxID=1295382 RepID=A0A8D4VPN6_9GAMM|nr:hypothetical protein [Methylogaea oryzae]BBL70362.1 hypothetical protein MoryE10_09680 [Methylogaea oryzae]